MKEPEAPSKQGAGTKVDLVYSEERVQRTKKQTARLNAYAARTLQDQAGNKRFTPKRGV